MSSPRNRHESPARDNRHELPARDYCHDGSTRDNCHEFPARDNYTQEEVARAYDDERRGLFRSLERLAVVRVIRELDRSGSILDVPCGTGYFLEIFEKHFARAEGVDISKPMLHQASLRKVSGEPLRVREADACELPFKDESFDTVFSIRFFGHTPPDIREAALREMARVARRQLILAFYVRSPLIRLRKGLQRQILSLAGETSSAPWYPFDSSSQVADLLASCGLNVKRVYPIWPHLLEERLFLVEKR